MLLRLQYLFEKYNFIGLKIKRWLWNLKLKFKNSFDYVIKCMQKSRNRLIENIYFPIFQFTSTDYLKLKMIIKIRQIWNFRICFSYQTFLSCMSICLKTNLFCLKTRGKQKISIMIDCKNFRKGIRQLEW